MAAPIDPAIFDAPRYVVPLGHLYVEADHVNVTLNDLPGRTPNGYQLDAVEVGLIESIDCTVEDRDFSPAERLRLRHLAELDLVAVLRADTEVFDIDLVPIRRNAVDLLPDANGQYRVKVGNGNEFLVDALGAMFISVMDGVLTVGQIAERLRRAVGESPDGRNLLSEVDEHGAEEFPRYLRNLVFLVIETIRSRGVGSIEPALPA